MSNDEEMRRRGVERARREQRERTEQGRKSNDIGRWFHNGIAEIRGETRERGWQSQRSVKLPSGRERVHDGARSLKDHEFREYKNARVVGGKFVMEQISKEREHLQTDSKAKGVWVVVRGSPDPAARRELEKLERDFKDRFQLVEISKEEANRAEKLGKQLERNTNQLELFKSSDLRAKERMRELQEKARDKQRVKEAAKRAIEQQAREHRQREERQQQREAADRLAQRAVERREASDRGERTPMSGREAADVLRISRPTPGVKPPRREPLPIAPVVKRSRNRSREREHDRSRGVEREH
ncbi:hypothetical protein [Nocardia carnea]|uniref:Uncharacterized protein n=1 Tax=Nocardia carnea TaxID=37328 RepID=A0ABW7TW42_9NOCA|nr:hypothetical protein [Nocardia carnea]